MGVPPAAPQVPRAGLTPARSKRDRRRAKRTSAGRVTAKTGGPRTPQLPPRYPPTCVNPARSERDRPRAERTTAGRDMAERAASLPSNGQGPPGVRFPRTALSFGMQMMRRPPLSLEVREHEQKKFKVSEAEQL